VKNGTVDLSDTRATIEFFEKELEYWVIPKSHSFSNLKKIQEEIFDVNPSFLDPGLSKAVID